MICIITLRRNEAMHTHRSVLRPFFRDFPGRLVCIFALHLPLHLARFRATSGDKFFFLTPSFNTSLQLLLGLPLIFYPLHPTLWVDIYEKYMLELYMFP
jgi:hypothetical protein